jgi:hypothetical protein
MPYTLRYDSTGDLASKALLTRALSLTASSKSIQSLQKATFYYHMIVYHTIVRCSVVRRPAKAAWATQGLAHNKRADDR